MKRIEIRNYERKKFLAYLGDNYKNQPKNNDVSNFFIEVEKDKENDIIKTILAPSYGSFSWYDGYDIFKIEYKEEGKPLPSEIGGPQYFQRLYVYYHDIDKLTEFINKTFAYEIKPDNNKIILYTSKSKSYGFWDKYNTIYAQSIENIFIDKKIKQDLIDYIDNFNNSKEKYIKFGRSHKFNLLLTGVPGSGKTCLSKALAKKYGYSIYILNFTKNMTDDILIDLISDIKENSILLLEDIDSYFVDRLSPNTNISYSCLINILDGTLTKGNGIITILTANYPDKLDSALFRPGRIDKIIKFDYPKKESILEAFIYLVYNNKVTEETTKDFNIFYDKIKNIKCSMSCIVDFLFRHPTDYNEQIKEFFDHINNVDEITKDCTDKIYL